jgi:hypothetical protein
VGLAEAETDAGAEDEVVTTTGLLVDIVGWAVVVVGTGTEMIVLSVDDGESTGEVLEPSDPPDPSVSLESSESSASQESPELSESESGTEVGSDTSLVVVGIARSKEVDAAF